MSRSVFMQVKVDVGLCARFQAAVERQQRPAARVLGQLMRDYVDRENVAELPLPPVQNGEDDIDAMVARQQGWSSCPFGTV